MLLKNDGILPLRKDVGTIAVVGPNADDLVTLLGNYYGTPSRPVTILAGIRSAVSPGTRVLYARGVDLVEGRQDPRAAPPIDSAYLRPVRGSSERGLKGEYFRGRELAGRARSDPRRPQGRASAGTAARRRTSRWPAASSTRRARSTATASRVRWSGTLVPPVSGEYELTATANDGVRLFVDGQKLLDEWSETSVARAVSARVSARGRPRARPPARVLRGRPRRRGAARLAPARRRHAVRRGRGRGARRRRRGLRRRADGRGRRRGDARHLPGLRRAATARTSSCPPSSRRCSRRSTRPASRWCWC